MRLASVGRMVPIAGRPLPALCFLALWHVSGTISCDSQLGYCQFSKFKVLSVSQLAAPSKACSYFFGHTLLFEMCSSMQICPPTSWACDVLQPFAHPRGYESCFSQVKKGLAFTDSLLQLSWSDISAGRSASIPRMLCFLGNGSTPHAIHVQFFLVRSTENTRRQERLTEQANAAPTSVLDMLKLHKIYWLLPVEELEKGNLTQLGLELPTARVSLIITKH